MLCFCGLCPFEIHDLTGLNWVSGGPTKQRKRSEEMMELWRHAWFTVQIKLIIEKPLTSILETGMVFTAAKRSFSPEGIRCTLLVLPKVLYSNQWVVNIKLQTESLFLLYHKMHMRPEASTEDKALSTHQQVCCNPCGLSLILYTAYSSPCFLPDSQKTAHGPWPCHLIFLY